MPYEPLTRTLYTIGATATGGREGRTTTEDGVIDLPLGKPGSRTNPKANPESLFAAGYAACYNNALATIARAEGIDVSGATTRVAVSLGTTETGVGISAEVTSTIPGVDAETAQRLAERAHETCPYSKATRGNIDVTVTATPA